MTSGPAPLQLKFAVEALQDGGVIACPTEAVWGLSCDPENEFSVARVLAMKRRPVAKGLILVAGAIDQFAQLLAGLPQPQLDKLVASWPGPVTWLVPHRGRVPPWIHGDHDTVAVRVSAHPAVRALCLAWGDRWCPPPPIALAPARPVMPLKCGARLEESLITCWQARLVAPHDPPRSGISPAAEFSVIEYC